jgi:hypothetical protein
VLGSNEITDLLALKADSWVLPQIIDPPSALLALTAYNVLLLLARGTAQTSRGKVLMHDISTFHFAPAAFYGDAS